MNDDDGLVEPNCWDVCCRPARNPAEFTSPQSTTNVGVTNKAIFDLLRYNQAGIVFLIVAGLAIVATWTVFSVVPGFARFDGDPTEISAVSHIGWWIPIEIITLVVGGLSVFISFQYNRDQKIEASISSLRGWLVFYIVILAIAIAANLVHLALSIVELTHCTSSLCMSNKGFLIVLLGFLVVLALLEAWAIYRVITYSTNLKNAFILSDTLPQAVVFGTAPEDVNFSFAPPQRSVQRHIMIEPAHVGQKKSRHGFKAK